MKKCLFALMILAAAPPLWGSTVYVGLAANAEILGTRYSTEIRVHNDSGSKRALTYLFIPEATSAVDFDRESGPIEVSLAPHSTTQFEDWVPEGARGMLEITADDEVHVTARLIGTTAAGGSSFGTELPVITAREARSPGNTAILSGLRHKDGQVASNVFLVNLSGERNTCAAEVFKRGGARAFESTLAQDPLLLSSFTQILPVLGLENKDDVSIAFTCDQLFYPFALVQELTTAEVLAVRPAGAGGAGFGPPAGPLQCPPEAICFDEPGTFFIPSLREPTRRIHMDVPEGQYTKVRLHIEVLHGGWQSPNSGLHNIFWFVLNGNRDQIGYVNFLGPNRNVLRFRHGMGLANEAKPRIDQPFKAIPGEIYTFDYFYDTSLRVIDLVVSIRGQEVARVFATPNVRRLDVDNKDRFLIDLSFKPGLNPNEPPTYGWQYRNLRVEFSP